VGHVFISDNCDYVIRGLNKEFFELQSKLLSEDFFQVLMKNNKVVNTTTIDKNQTHKSVYQCYGYLQHDRINQITYPYEWSFDQLKDAALLQLEIMVDSINHGWILKDATSYNVQFLNNQAIFIDTPSFIPYKDGDNWDAYRQFCMLFLNPLFLESYLQIDFRPLLRSNLDGIDPKFMSKVFSGMKIFKRGILSNVVLPAMVENNILKNERDTNQAKNRGNIKQSKLRLLALLDSLRRLITSLKSPSSISEWGDYDHINTYAEKDNELKKQFILSAVQGLEPNLTWDMGANTGLFSEHIKDYSNHILAIDGDGIAVNKMYKRLKNLEIKNITPLVMNLANISPNQGFAGKERLALEERNKPDFVMCLAVIHHIRLSANIPCKYFLEYLHSFSCDVVIEFVNREDEMVQKLLVNKKEQYLDYNINSFRLDLSNFFEIVASVKLKNGDRELFHLTPLKDV